MESKKVKTLEEYVLNKLYDTEEELENTKKYQRYLQETNKAFEDTLNDLIDKVRVALANSEVTVENGITSIRVQGTYIGCYSEWDIEQKREQPLKLQALANLINKVNGTNVERQGEEE